MPFERGLLLCQEYNVLDLLKPLLEYQSKASSPPLAPKHITAASFKPRKVREPRPPKGTKAKLKASGKLSARSGGPVMGVIDGPGRDHSSHTFGGDEDDDASTSEMDDQDAQTREGTCLRDPRTHVIDCSLLFVRQERLTLWIDILACE